MFASLKHKFKIWPRSKHTQSRITKTCTGIKKTNKPIDAPNLHKHQKTKKKQTTRCIKPAKATKKIKKKLKFPGTMGPLLSSCWNFCFFLFFWCLSMFGASSGLFFCFFWCLSMFLYISCQDHDEKSVFY